MANVSAFNDEFQKFLVELSNARGFATKATFNKERNITKLEDIAESDREGIAHFWDAGHEFWTKEENAKYGITATSKLPIKYATLGQWKKKFKKTTDTDTENKDSDTPPITPKVLTFEEEELQYSRQGLVMKYAKVVHLAQQELDAVNKVLKDNPELSTQEELDEHLNKTES